MAGSENTTSLPFPQAVGAMRALLIAPNPDARLIQACDRLMLLTEQKEAVFQEPPAGRFSRIQALLTEQAKLEVEIAGTHAHTDAGRRAKADAALHRVEAIGSAALLVRSAMYDFLAHADAGEGA